MSGMNGPTFDILRRWDAVDCRAEYVENPRHDFLADRTLERLV